MLIRAAAAAAAGLALAVPASAQTTQRDLEVIGRALGFIDGAGGAERVLAILHAGDAAAEAADLAGVIGGGLAAGRVTVRGRVVEGGDAAALAGAHAVLLLGEAARDGALARDAAEGGRLTVSTDMACVEAGRCVMGVESEPAVRIVVNRAAADSAGVGFDAAFAMMIEEI